MFLDKNTDGASVDQQRCKLADFGLSLLFAKGKSKLDNAGTGPWKAPEVNLKVENSMFVYLLVSYGVGKKKKKKKKGL